MKNPIITLLFMLMVTGCAAATQDSAAEMAPISGGQSAATAMDAETAEMDDQTHFSKATEISKMAGMTRHFLSLRQVQKGMTKKEVEEVLGSQVIVGYEMADPDTAQYKPITKPQPHRTEVIQRGNKEYEVDYYLVGIKTPDNNITDDELVPLVFYNGKLLGTGWIFLSQTIRTNP